MSRGVLILVEGQTEEQFVKNVLGPFYGAHLYFYPTLLRTKQVKEGGHFKGGVTNFANFSNDLTKLFHSAGGRLVTTMLDYYGLPTDFPGMNDLPSAGSSLRRAIHVEKAIADHFGNLPNFVPFLALHEFEAWLFSSVDELPSVMTKERQQAKFAAIRNSFSTPEEINDSPQLAPSKRIASLFPAYRKAFHGPIVAKRIGLEKIRAECAHFNEWLGKLEAFAAV